MMTKTTMTVLAAATWFVAGAASAASCTETTPISHISVAANSIGTGLPVSVNFMGNIQSRGRGNNDVIRVCAGTTLEYSVVGGADVVSCRLNGDPVASSGMLSVAKGGGQKLICTGRPAGNGMDRFRIVGVD